jgi:hypothetical protein
MNILTALKNKKIQCLVFAPLYIFISYFLGSSIFTVIWILQALFFIRPDIFVKKKTMVI